MEGLRLGISKTEWRILTALSGAETLSVTDIARMLSSPKSLVSRILTGLRKRELASESVLRGRRRRYRLGDWLAQPFRLLVVNNPRLPFDKVLWGNALDVLWAGMNSEWDARLLTKMFPKATLARTLGRLKSFGIVGRLNRLKPYSINIPELKALLNALGGHGMSLIAKNFEPGAAIHAFNRTSTEFIIASSLAVEKQGFVMTGLDRFPEFGVKVATPGTTYYYVCPRKKTLRAEEVLVHALQLGRDDNRTLTYCLILFDKLRKSGKFDAALFAREASKWWVGELAQGMEKYLATEGKEGLAIPWKEFQDTRRVYAK